MQISKASENSTSIQAQGDINITQKGLSLADVETFFNVLINANISKITDAVSDKLSENLSNILERSKVIVSDHKNTNIPLRILKNIVNDGMFCDEKICQEYYAGILAGSSEAKNDSGIFYTNLVSNLTSKALYIHYYLYSSSLYYGKVVQEKEALSNRFIIDEDSFSNLFGDMENLNTYIINETLASLHSEGLLKEYGIYTKEKIKKEYRIDVNLEACFMFQTTRKGQYFFLWACGVANVEWLLAKEKCTLFPETLHLKKPMFCKNVFSEGDAYISVYNE